MNEGCKVNLVKMVSQDKLDLKDRRVMRVATVDLEFKVLKVSPDLQEKEALLDLLDLLDSPVCQEPLVYLVHLVRKVSQAWLDLPAHQDHQVLVEREVSLAIEDNQDNLEAREKREKPALKVLMDLRVPKV